MKYETELLKMLSKKYANSEITGIKWVSDYTGLAETTIRSKVSKEEIPYKKRGKPLLFSKEKIVEWNENGRQRNDLL